MFQNPGVPKESPRGRHGVCPIFPALCVMVWQCLIIFSKKCLSPLDNFGKRCYPLRIRKAALPYSGFRSSFRQKGVRFVSGCPFVLPFSKKTPKTLTRPWAGVHNYSYTVPVSPLPSPGRSAPGVFCGADSGRTAAPAFIFPCRRTALQSRSLAAKTEGCGVFGFFRPSGNRQNRIRHPASSHPPFFGSSAAPPACFCNMRPVFLQNRTDNF